MNGKIGLIIAITLCSVVHASTEFLPDTSSTISIGDRLERSFTVYSTLPTTTEEARSLGWGPTQGYEGKCSSGLGEPWSQSNGALPSKHQPLWLYFTPERAGGQASGSAVLFYNHIWHQKQNLIDQGYIVPSDMVPSAPYQVSVGFRDPDDACTTGSSPSSLKLGDRLVINPEGVARHVPLTATEAQAQGWHKGSCFAGMGTHWFLDLSLQNGTMSWEIKNLLPIVTMYDEESENPTGQINAFFFASSVIQQTFIWPNANQWEPIPLPNFAMCKNLCDDGCTFHDTWWTSTLHIYLNDRSRVTCKDGCSIGCCSD